MKRFIEKITPSAPTDGMTLIEVMIALGLATALMMAVMQGTVLSQRAARSTTLLGDWNNVASAIRLVLSNEAACKAAMKGKSLSAANDTVVTQLAIGANVIAQQGKPDVGLKITAMAMRPMPGTDVVSMVGTPPVAMTRKIVTLTVQGQKTTMPGDTVLGNRDYKLDLLFTAVTDAAGVIQSCDATFSSSQACADLGGTYDDTKTPKCQLNTYLHDCHAVSGVSCAPNEVAMSATTSCPNNYIRSSGPAGKGGWGLSCAGATTPVSGLYCCKGGG